MNCPVCREALMMTERQGVEIDYCPKCRGVWLDRGELDKIIERSTGAPQYKSDYKKHDHEDRHRYEHSKDYKKKKRESFLSDLFDF